VNSEGPLIPEEFWNRVRRRFAGRYPGFHDEAVLSPAGRPPSTAPPSTVGVWRGRLWELRYQGPALFAPSSQIGVTTAVRLVEPEGMPLERIPWVYAGLRPGVFTRGSMSLDRILARYRRVRGKRQGALTGDADLDQRWAVYAYSPQVAGVFREPETRAFLRNSEQLSPNPRSILPAVFMYGTEATLNLPVGNLPEQVDTVATTFDGFSRVLDRAEASRGHAPASTTPIPMDLEHDLEGAPFPTARISCPFCHQVTHPRYHPDFDTEVCEKCRHALYELG
jgi:hypothetical protein